MIQRLRIPAGVAQVTHMDFLPPPCPGRPGVASGMHGIGRGSGMKRAEQVTFGGSGLDRAAQIRSDDAKLAQALQHPGAKCVVLWRGKLLLEGDGLDRLALLPLSHKVLIDEGANSPLPILFLGLLDDGAPCFARDISRWEPVGQDLSAVGNFVDPSVQRHPELPDDLGFAELRRVMVRLTLRAAELAATAKAVVGWHETHRFCARCGSESVVVQGGWQRSCLSCGGQHFPRTDPVVIMLVTYGGKVLLGRSPGWPEGMYSLLAGFVEPGETIEAAVRREVMEEAGVPVGQVDYLASQPWPFPASLMIGCSGVALSDRISIDPVEIEDALWVTKSDMMQVFAGEHPVIQPARKGAIAHFLLRNWLADTLD